MYFPRRHRRKLFFPPGLLALACLLLLGCMQIEKYPDLRPKKVLPLVLSPLHLTSEQLPLFKHSIPFLAIPYLSNEEIEKFRPWDELIITGNQIADSITLSTANKIIASYQQDTLHAKGLRVRFLNDARYRSMVGILNSMMVNNMRNYCLDLHRTPVTFYAFTKKRSPYTTRYTDCVNCDYASMYTKFQGMLNRWTMFLRNPETWRPLLHEWRNSIFLLFLIGIVSIYKTVQLCFQLRNPTPSSAVE